MIASELLDQIATEYADAKVAFRDRILACGAMVFTYVTKRMEDGASYLDACREIDTRIGPIGCKADSPKAGHVRSTLAHVLIHIAKIVEFYGSPGTLSVSALRALRALVRYRRGSSTFEKRPGDLWQPIYAQAVAESWGTEKCAAALARLSCRRRQIDKVRRQRYKTHRTKRYAQECETAIQNASIFVDAARHGSVGDVADMVLSIVNASTNPRAVAEKVLPKLLAIKQREAVAL